jgi:hypothetical protein
MKLLLPFGFEFGIVYPTKERFLAFVTVNDLIHACNNIIVLLYYIQEDGHIRALQR